METVQVGTTTWFRPLEWPKAATVQIQVCRYRCAETGVQRQVCKDRCEETGA